MTPQERKNFESIRDNVHSDPMTQVEAMKLALEYLQDNQHLIADNERHAYVMEYNAFIERFKETIEQAQKDYPFGIYGAEDLDKAWKSGYDNCKAQAPWTLEDVKKSWKSGYQAGLEQAQKQEPDVSNKLHFDCEFVDGTCADLTVYGSERDIKRLEARIKFWWNLEQAQKQEPWPEEPAGHMAGGVKPSNMTRNKAITQIYALFGAPNNADINLTGLSMLLDELMDSSPKQKQEPVAWVCYSTDEKHGIDYEDEEINALPVGTMLYTSPPQRQWVGLTDEETNTEAVKEEQAYGFVQGALWAEAKLKEKNNG